MHLHTTRAPFETMEAMKEYKIEPKALRLVAASPEKAPWLCLVEGRLGGKRA